VTNFKDEIKEVIEKIVDQKLSKIYRCWN